MSVWWALLVRACVFIHRVVMCISHEASAHWSVDGSLNYNYSYLRTFTAVTPRYRTWWARPEPTTHAQQEFVILRTSVFDTDFCCLTRTILQGVLAMILPSSSSSLRSFPRIADALSPKVDSSPSPSSAPWSGNASTLTWLIRTNTYGEEFKYFVYIMTKGTSSAQRMQLWRRSSCKQTSPRPLCSSPWTPIPKRNSCQIWSCSKDVFYYYFKNIYLCLQVILFIY